MFGFIKLPVFSYLILIEEASIVGQLMKANIFRVDKLLYLPLRNDSNRLIAAEDLIFV